MADHNSHALSCFGTGLVQKWIQLRIEILAVPSQVVDVEHVGESGFLRCQGRHHATPRPSGVVFAKVVSLSWAKILTSMENGERVRPGPPLVLDLSYRDSKAPSVL
jgi:hypothetical protein